MNELKDFKDCKTFGLHSREERYNVHGYSRHETDPQQSSSETIRYTIIEELLGSEQEQFMKNK